MSSIRGPNAVILGPSGGVRSEDFVARQEVFPSDSAPRSPRNLARSRRIR
jgi:hypothetical protein